MHRMKLINRWGLMRSTETENVAEHCLMTGILAHALAVIKNGLFGGNLDADKIMTAAVYHDAGEVVTGDLPAPIKYFNPDIQKAYKKLESVAADKLLAMLPDKLRPAYYPAFKPEPASYEYALIKTADKLSAYIKCLDELKTGNAEFKKAKQAIEDELLTAPSDELKYFMDNFIQPFGLSLDELR